MSEISNNFYKHDWEDYRLKPEVKKALLKKTKAELVAELEKAWDRSERNENRMLYFRRAATDQMGKGPDARDSEPNEPGWCDKEVYDAIVKAFEQARAGLRWGR